MIDNYAIPSYSSYIQHEAWFEIMDLEFAGKHGKLIINSYGRVREVWEDGTYFDRHDGEPLRAEQREKLLTEDKK